MTVKMHKEQYESTTMRKTEQIYDKFLKMAYLQWLVRVQDLIVPMPQLKKKINRDSAEKASGVGQRCADG